MRRFLRVRYAAVAAVAAALGVAGAILLTPTNSSRPSPASPTENLTQTPGFQATSENFSRAQQRASLRAAATLWREASPRSADPALRRCSPSRVELRFAPQLRLGENVLGQAQLGGCEPSSQARGAQPEILLWSGILLGELQPIQSCRVIAHEMGHLLGHSHSPDPLSVMHQRGSAGEELAPAQATDALALALCADQLARL